MHLMTHGTSSSSSLLVPFASSNEAMTPASTNPECLLLLASALQRMHGKPEAAG